MNLKIIIVCAILIMVVAISLYKIITSAMVLSSNKHIKRIKTIDGKISFEKIMDDNLINPIAKVFSKIIKIDQYDRAKIQTDLVRTNNPYSPEMFYGRAITQSVLMGAVGALFLPFGLSTITIVLEIMAVIMFFLSISTLNSKIKAKNKIVEGDLPAFIGILNCNMKENKNLTLFFERSLKVVSTEFRPDIERLLFDYGTGNHAEALRAFDARLRIPDLTQVVQLLIGLEQGIDQNDALADIEQDLNVKQKEKGKVIVDKKQMGMNIVMIMLIAAMLLILLVPFIVTTMNPNSLSMM